MTGTTTIVVTDIVTSTEMLTTAGDDAGTAALTGALRSMREHLEHGGGNVIKSLGDGVMALFESSYEAVLAAITLQQQFTRPGRDSEPDGPRIRIGCNVGEVIAAGDTDQADVFGAAVVVAHRLCAHAQADEILVTDLVRLLIGSRGDIEFRALGAVSLKGFPDPMVVHAVQWSPLPPTPPCRVVIADDAALIRTGIARLLADEGFDVVGQAGDADELLRLVEALQPDLVVTDIRMPPEHRDEGLRAAVEIRARDDGVAVLVLSQYVEASAAATLLDDRLEGVGYLLKERVEALDEFVEACRVVASGGRVIDELLAQQLMQQSRRVDPLDQLTPREREVLSLMAQGRSNAAIATSLHLSSKTIESHVRAIFTKLGLEENADDHRRVAAVVRFLDET